MYKKHHVFLSFANFKFYLQSLTLLTPCSPLLLLPKCFNFLLLGLLYFNLSKKQTGGRLLKTPCFAVRAYLKSYSPLFFLPASFIPSHLNLWPTPLVEKLLVQGGARPRHKKTGYSQEVQILFPERNSQEHALKRHAPAHYRKTCFFLP